jgi:hypothetical protein
MQYTHTYAQMVNVVKGGGRAPPPSPAWANFTLMIVATVCTLCVKPQSTHSGNGHFLAYIPS